MAHHGRLLTALKWMRQPGLPVLLLILICLGFAVDGLAQNRPDLIVDDFIASRTNGKIVLTVTVQNIGKKATPNDQRIQASDEMKSGIKHLSCEIIKSDPEEAKPDFRAIARSGGPGITLTWPRTLKLKPNRSLSVQIECDRKTDEDVEKRAIVDPTLEYWPNGRIKESNEDNNVDGDTKRNPEIKTPKEFHPKEASEDDRDEEGEENDKGKTVKVTVKEVGKPNEECGEVINVPFLVNVHTDKNKAKLKKKFRMVLEDVNKMLCQCGFQIEANVTFNFKKEKDSTPEWFQSSYRSNSDKLDKALEKGWDELKAEFGKGKGQKIIIIDEFTDNSNKLGEGLEPGPVSMLTWDALELRTFRVGSSNYKTRAVSGPAFLHEIGHNADLGHKTGTFMMEKFSNFVSLSGEVLEPPRNITDGQKDGQCDTLKKYFTGRSCENNGGNIGGGGDDNGGDNRKFKVDSFDKNNNCRIDQPELFDAIDQWTAGDIEQSLMFNVIDAWTMKTNVCESDEGDDDGSDDEQLEIPSLDEPRCMLEGNRVDCSNIRLNRPEAAVGLGLGEEVRLPQGSELELEISTSTAGFELTGGTINSALFDGFVRQVGTRLLAQLSVTAPSGATLQRTTELFRILLAIQVADLTTARLNVEGEVTGPSGNILQSFAWLLRFNIALQGLESLSVTDFQANLTDSGSVNFRAVGSGISRLNVEVFNLSGQTVYMESAKGSSLRWKGLNSTGDPLANGVYLYRVTAHGPDGTVQRSRVRKLVVMR